MNTKKRLKNQKKNLFLLARHFWVLRPWRSRLPSRCAPSRRDYPACDRVWGDALRPPRCRTQCARRPHWPRTRATAKAKKSVCERARDEHKQRIAPQSLTLWCIRVTMAVAPPIIGGSLISISSCSSRKVRESAFFATTNEINNKKK